MKLVVGLGNPGNEYKNTRHNIGFNFLDFLAKIYNLKFTYDKKFNAESCSFTIQNEKVLLVKPFSFMNLSGVVVSKYKNFYNLSSNDILIIHDDLDMNLGKIRAVYDSSSGGHNGIKNIIENIGTQQFYRLKIGISNNKNIDTKDYVLGKFNSEEKKIIDDAYFKIKDIVDDFINLNLSDLRQKYNSMNN